MVGEATGTGSSFSLGSNSNNGGSGATDISTWKLANADADDPTTRSEMAFGVAAVGVGTMLGIILFVSAAGLLFLVARKIG
jgi:hypothetical protein